VKIDKPSKPLPAGTIGDKPSHVSAGKTSPATSTLQPDSTSVSLGTKATQLQSMESSMASSPVVDPHKVAEIKQAISQGQFHVNTSVVADKLLESVQTLIGSKG